mmetsp:Transcript_61710/g.134042  ORF Transcript_61710/g.134042 Transcript_61710/m.134042 type:complete len:287 (-) Transcript_61710:358-1218(-)
MTAVVSVVESTVLRSARASGRRVKVQTSPVEEKPGKKRPAGRLRMASGSISTRKAPPTRSRMAPRLVGAMCSVERYSPATRLVVRDTEASPAWASYTTRSEVSPTWTMRTLPATAAMTPSKVMEIPPWARTAALESSSPRDGKTNSAVGCAPPASQKFQCLGAARPAKERPSVEVRAGTSTAQPRCLVMAAMLVTGMVRPVMLWSLVAKVVSNAASPSPCMPAVMLYTLIGLVGTRGAASKVRVSGATGVATGNWLCSGVVVTTLKAVDGAVTLNLNWDVLWKPVK